MAVDKKISQLTSLAQVNVDAALDVLPIVDTSAVETKKITVSALVGAGATAGISGAVLTNGTINSTTIGATTPSTGAFTTLTTSSTVTLNGGTANGVLYLNGSKVATSGSALTYDGTTFTSGAHTLSTGNLTFSSTAQRITGDFSNATVASRLFFQNSTTNAITRVGAIPNGTATESGYNFYNTSAVTTGEFGQLYITSSEVTLRSAVLAGGSFLPLTFYTGGSERMRLDTSGNLLVGATSADAKFSVHATNLTIPAISARYSAAGYKMGFGVYNVLGYPYLALNCNQVASSNNQTYDLSAFASKLDLAIDNTSGGFVFSTAASGTAGNTITWSERMRIDGSTGNVGIGTASPAVKLDLGSDLTAQKLFVFASGLSRAGFGVQSGDFRMFTPSDAAMTFGSMSTATGTTYTERMRIDSSGNVAVGFTGNAGQGIFQVARTISGGGPATSGTTDANQVMVFNASSVQLGYGAYVDGTGWIQQRATGSYAINYALAIQPNGGNVGIGIIPNASFILQVKPATNVTLGIQSGTTVGGALTINAVNNANSANVPLDFRSSATYFSAGIGTTASAANAYIDNAANNQLLRSTSSLRYKRDVATYARGLSELMTLRAVSFKGISESDGDKTFAGLIAEEVHDAGLTEFVAYDKEGRPDALHYGNMVALLVKAVQELSAKVTALEAR